jgi:hypothetical protein
MLASETPEITLTLIPVAYLPTGADDMACRVLGLSGKASANCDRTGT